MGSCTFGLVFSNLLPFFIACPNQLFRNSFNFYRYNLFLCLLEPVIECRVWNIVANAERVDGNSIGLTLGFVEEPQSFLSSFKFSTKVCERDMLVNTPILEAYVSEIDVGRKTEITQVNIGIEVAGQISVAETTHGMNRRIIVSYIARQAEHPVERVRSRQYGSIVMNVSTVNERPDEVSILNIIVVNHRIMLQLVLENGRKSGFLYLTGIIQERIE